MGETCGHPSRSIGLAFLCSICAGLSIVVGTCVTLLTNRNNRMVLASTLSFSSGVIFYVALVDLYLNDGVGYFEEDGHPYKEAFVYSSLCFFGGFPVCWSLSLMSHWLLTKGSEMSKAKRLAKEKAQADDPEGGLVNPEVIKARNKDGSLVVTVLNSPSEVELGQARNESVVITADGRLKDVEEDLDDPKHALNAHGQDKGGAVVVAPFKGAPLVEIKPVAEKSTGVFGFFRDIYDQLNHVHADTYINVDDDDEEAEMLAEMGLLVGIAIVIHNFPEGLLTFVGYVGGFQTAVATVFAIVVHNIPEGMIVAMPIYYGTGSKLKSIGIVSLMGLSVPFGSLIGLSILCGNALNNIAYAVLFSITGGILVYVVLKEVWPKSRRYDPNDRFATFFFSCGMIVMCLSLVAINYSEEEDSSSSDSSSSDSSGSSSSTDYFSF